MGLFVSLFSAFFSVFFFKFNFLWGIVQWISPFSWGETLYLENRPKAKSQKTKRPEDQCPIDGKGHRSEAGSEAPTRRKLKA